MTTKQYLLDNLTGLGPIDWEQAKKDYNFDGFFRRGLDINKILPRDEVMLSLIDVTEQMSMEEYLNKMKLADNAPDELRELKNLARQFIILRNKQARLPKFSKWISSMFQANPVLMNVLAKQGQNAGGKNNIIISCNPVDILRGADTQHFFTCLGHDGGYNTVLPGVLQECPGVAVAYIDDENGKMLARCWIHHIEVNGKTAIQMNRPYGNGITHEVLAKMIAAKGYDVYDQDGWYNRGANAVNYKFINNFKRQIHWDALETAARGSLIEKAVGAPRVAKKKKAA